MLTAWLTGAESLADPFLVLLVALALDAALGDPLWLYSTVPHPVAMVGRLVGLGERWLNKPEAGEQGRRIRGALLTVAVVLIAAAVGWVLADVLEDLPGGWLVEALLASTLVAFRGLYDHAKTVAEDDSGSDLLASPSELPGETVEDPGARGLGLALVGDQASTPFHENDVVTGNRRWTPSFQGNPPR